MSLSIDRVETPRDLAQFLKVVYRIYGKDHPQYVFPLLAQMKPFLDPKKNPFFEKAETQLWIARDGAMPVGRIGAAIDTVSNEYHDEQVGMFGFYEATDDPEVAEALLETARKWIADKGMTTMRGPGCFSTNHEYLGLHVQGFERRPALGMPYHHPYYLKQMEAFGLTKAKDLFDWEFTAPDNKAPARISDFAERLQKRQNFTIRRFRMDKFWEDVEIVRDIYFEAWKDNWGFVPMDEEMFRHSAQDMKSMVNPGFLLIAEHDGKPIGFSMSTQDFNQALYSLKGSLLPFGWLKFLINKRKIDGARTLLMGVIPEYRKTGVDVMLVSETIKFGTSVGIARSSCSWILEDNVAMNRTLEKYGSKVVNVYRILEKAV